MANNVTNTSITLKIYVEILRRASKGSLGYIRDLKGVENRAARELLKSGLISDDPIQFENAKSKIVNEASLTPEGASALENWSSYLRESSIAYKVGGTLLKLLWVLIGALAASLTDIVKIFAS